VGGWCDTSSPAHTQILDARSHTVSMRICRGGIALAAAATSTQPPHLPMRSQLARLLACAPAATGISGALGEVQKRLASAADAAEMPAPRLVAVSKTKPVELLREAYDAGMRDFGENYVQELVSKAPEMPNDVAWRFIGKLQSNKAKLLVHGVPSLAVVETLDSAKLADRLEKAMQELSPLRSEPLGVMVQVNTSPWEGSKGGVLAEEAPALAAHVAAKCPSLRLTGLMTIGAPGKLACFTTLRECREAVAAELGIEAQALELSMGMSGDFEAAIAKGSSSVRVGSSIFGARDYPPKAKEN